MEQISESYFETIKHPTFKWDCNTGHLHSGKHNA